MKDTFKDNLSYSIKIYESIGIEEYFFIFLSKLKAAKGQIECPRDMNRLNAG
jgi:hypothetical protein